MPTQKAGRRGQSNQYDTEVIIKWLIARELGKVDLAEMDKERLRLIKAQADKIEMENEVSKGNLLPAQEAINAWASQIIIARNKIMAVPSRFAPQLVGLKALDIEEKLRLALKQALAELKSDVGTESNK